nr:hypothetical protein [uncultured Desulfuromonas sp.]
MTTFYLPRHLSSNGKTYTETELLSTSNFVVVLAEPGGGKTELMRSLAQSLGCTAVTASKFAYIGAKAEKIPLVIDAFDELAKVDASGMEKLFGLATTACPTHVYLSSRSSEWDQAATKAFEDFFEHPPLVVRLCEFDEAEQREIFVHHAPEEDFAAFQKEVSRFDLESLLPNPQFLKLFADAYIESERHFVDKQSIFAQAIERLAKEANPTAKKINPPLSTTQKANLAAEVFCKLLLSGAEGISTSEATENRIYPLLAALFDRDTAANRILATRLFKPGDSVDQHRPVHKIVAEYCAADYLTKRIANPADPLTLSKCLPIIAPNFVVRDELRGLLGWMAALGNKPIEEAAINLDPYAVLANGDPSQLESSSKRLLVNCLKKIEAQDPYFRRGDSWRRFSVSGFFTSDVIEEIKPLLINGGGGHLCDLVLELLVGTPAVKQLNGELLQLVITPDESENTRLLANKCLLDIDDEDLRSRLDILISEASNTSLKIVAETIESLGLDSFDRTYLSEFFQACTKLYPDHKAQRRERRIGARFFLKKFITKLDLSTLEWLLDELTRNLTCVCGKKPYKCDCRNGTSKIVGAMLDRYFDLSEPPFDPIQIWHWVKNLNFHQNKTIDQSKAVKVLQEDDSLRQGIIAHVFEKLTDQDVISETKSNLFDWHSHSGINFCRNDYKFVVDLAFATDNPHLWVSFLERHEFYRDKEERGPDELRRHMREQALKKPTFMREWAKENRAAKKFQREHRKPRFRCNRRIRRLLKQEEDSRSANIKYIQENRELIESGRHWNCLVHFAELVLTEPDKIEQEVGDEKLVRNALRNCLDFIAPHVPDLLELAQLQYQVSETILYAASLEILRAKKCLDGIDHRLLRALRTGINMDYSTVSSEDREALLREVDRLIFADNDSAENFLRQYLEPQLESPECVYPQVGFLQCEKAFSHLRPTLSIEWLGRFRELDLNSLNILFDIAAQYGNRDHLRELVAERCAEFMADWPNLTEDEDLEKKRTFWLLRAWYFLNNPPEICWNWLKRNRDIVFICYERSGRTSFGDYPYWPKLSSQKIEALLDAYIDKWPKVDLPSSYGTGSPKEEKAYRFLTEVIRTIDSDDPDDAIPVLQRLLDDPRFSDLHNDLKSIHANQIRKKALRDFEPPTPEEIVDRLDRDSVVTVEGLRQLVIQELQDFQKTIDGGEFNSADRFYEKGQRLNEVRSTEIIAERLNHRLEPQGITVTLEHQLKGAKRSDFTVTKMIGGRRRLLVTEVKGQWHDELYTAAANQLHDRYSIHPDAEQQGVFLVIWFGADEKVAGCKTHGIRKAQELKSSIEARLPSELKGFIDVFVLDVSKPPK